MKNSQEQKEQIKNEYNNLIRRYYDLMRQADVLKDRIEQIQGLVEYEK